MTKSIRDRIVGGDIPEDKWEDLREALGLSQMEWRSVLDSKDVTSMERLLAKYLGLAEED